MATTWKSLTKRPKRSYSALGKLIHSKWFLGGTAFAVFIWTVIRGIPAWPLATYGMNIWIFILIDLLTAYPYVVCIKNIATGLRTRSSWKLALDGVVIAISFSAPYAYIFWSAGVAMPVWAIITVAVIVVAMAVFGPIRAVVRAWKGVR